MKQSIGSGATSLWLVVLLTASVIAPVFLVEIPAMTDYPNHLARMYLLSALGTPEENPYYVADWELYPNLVMDLVVPPMARFMDVETATKAFLVVSQILVVSGAVVLEIVIKRRHEFAGFSAAMALYSMPFSWGFLNFEFGTGVALWGIASWFALEKWKLYTRFVVHSLFVFSLFIAHLFALGLYGATIGIYELYRIQAHKFDLKKIAPVLAVLVGPTLILIGYAAFSGSQIGNSRTEWHLISKPMSIINAWNAYNAGLSGFIFILIFMLFYFLFRSRHLSLVPVGKWIAAGFLILFIALPFRLLGSAFADIRIVIAAILIMPAFLAFSSTKQMIRLLPPLVLSVVALLNAGYVATVWLAYRLEYAGLKSSFAMIERGAFVLVSYSGTPGPLLHAPVLAVHYANAFVPSLFTAPFTPIKRQLVLRVPEAKRLNIAHMRYYTHYTPVPFSVLSAISKKRALPGFPIHLACWMEYFDYLYVIGADARDPMPDRLTAIAAGKRFKLFRIKKSLGETCFEN